MLVVGDISPEFKPDFCFCGETKNNNDGIEIILILLNSRNTSLGVKNTCHINSNS